MNQLKTRGVTSPDEFATLNDATILDTIRWFDLQEGRVGAGVLVAELRNGGRQPTRRNTTAEQQAYADAIVASLRRHFPEFDRPVDGPHPAAIAAVIRLHWLYGKDVAVLEHGGTIRAAVTTWDGS